MRYKLPTTRPDLARAPLHGTVDSAVDRYTDIPLATRQRLKQRMQAFRYDELATIRRDSISGRASYAPELVGMHFGAGTLCATVSRSGWDAAHVERGLVYCEDGHCVIVPTVCRNVSRITRHSAQQQEQPEATLSAAASQGGGTGTGTGTGTSTGPAADGAAALPPAASADPPEPAMATAMVPAPLPEEPVPALVPQELPWAAAAVAAQMPSWGSGAPWAGWLPPSTGSVAPALPEPGVRTLLGTALLALAPGLWWRRRRPA